MKTILKILIQINLVIFVMFLAHLSYDVNVYYLIIPVEIINWHTTKLIFCGILLAILNFFYSEAKE